ncbi:hypothetical protein BTO09_14295 [Gilvibacter sp. SZ-19]|uniref:Smr/MutS family protein n=1 Tax=Gilvibacter sp. SZ-19 TaxID=754429 RepID=UPI000B3D103E|nr:Smr/MutS family protein [Gilvibacter sp. SZ-19]ARV13438.1 hypothetical protein BTO09_14295 [Gilvibacter sp. SZ-19]
MTIKNRESGFSVGDLVEVIEDNIRGEIKAINGNIALVTTTDGFDLEFECKALVPQLDQQPLNLSAAQQKQREFSRETKLKKKRKIQPRREKVIPPMEVDLHIEKLVKDHHRLLPHEHLEIQLERAKRSIDLAIQKRLPKLVLIHGVGEGVLKTELQFLIGRYDGLRYEPADYQKYGQGATLIHLSQKASRW